MNLFDKDVPYNDLPDLPPPVEIETPELLRLAIRANKLLAELKGFCQVLPNPNLLLNTIVLQESKDSSAIENIVTTQDELYKATLDLLFDKIKNPAAKEVIFYRKALYWGVENMRNNGLITANLLTGIMQKIRGVDDIIRRGAGTKLANPASGQIVYTPPEGENVIRDKMSGLEKFINDDDFYPADPLVKMALIHYQFEAIHPFTDGNGRTGRILNVLYLINKGLLTLPALYLSRYIIQHKADYYRLLREVTERQNWREWVEFVLNGVAETAHITLNQINLILQMKQKLEPDVRDAMKGSFAKEMLDLLFSYPYIKISVLERHGIAKRQTASQYLKKLESKGILKSVKIGTNLYYINHALVDLLSE